MLPKDYKARKAIPLYTYLTQYGPNALIEIAKVAVAGNEQHNPGEPMHWAKGKSMDQLNTAMRHLFDHGMGNAYDADDPWRDAQGQPILHLAKAAWRLIAEIELLCEARDAGIDINKLVRGTHEYLAPEPHPEAPKLEDYVATPMLMDGPHPVEGYTYATNTYMTLEQAAGLVDLVPVGTGPLEPLVVSSHSSEATQRGEVPPAPRGRLLTCGCFANCTGQTPRCPAWKSPAPYRADEWEQPDMATRVND